jgi:isopentenyl-diphosphate delta-isomerase
MTDRKDDHIKLALASQTAAGKYQQGFHYEPMFSSHELALSDSKGLERNFLGKTLKAPLWISSMTGGGSLSGELNKVFAEACAEFGLGMGLGSCRPVLEDPKSFDDFNVRSIIGPDLPLLSNIGHAQAEQLLLNGEIVKLDEMNQRLSCDALILHINPLQEWFQPEGDRFKLSSYELIQRMLDKIQTPLVVKEVGQGMGPRSLKALIELGVAGIEFGAFGGTNFSKLEVLRSKDFSAEQEIDPLCLVGHTAEQMVGYLNDLKNGDAQRNKALPMIIISGGIKNYLHGYELMQTLQSESMYAQAGMLLKKARESKESLFKYIQGQINGLLIAQAYLKVQKDQNS